MKNVNGAMVWLREYVEELKELGRINPDLKTEDVAEVLLNSDDLWHEIDFVAMEVLKENNMTI